MFVNTILILTFERITPEKFTLVFKLYGSELIELLSAPSSAQTLPQLHYLFKTLYILASNRQHIDVQGENSRYGNQRTQICLVIINYSGVWFLVVLAVWNHSSCSYRVANVLKM